MKKRFAAATEHPVAIRSRGTTRHQGSNRSCDVKKTKRVRFDDTEMDSVPDSIRERKMTRSPKSDAPKTSEYAYFRNIKNGAVRGRSRSYVDIKPSDIVEPSSKDLRFSDCRETEGVRPQSKQGLSAGQFDHRFLLTPPVTKYEEPSQGVIKERPLLLSENVKPVDRISSLSTLREASKNASLSGNQCNEGGIFSAKRRRLRQWAHNSMSEVEKLHPEGVGLISSLLSRLYPKCNESDLFYLHGSSKGETGNGCNAPIVRESKNLEERLHLSHKREWDTELPKICFGGYRERVFLEPDAYFSGSPFNNLGTETVFLEPDAHFSGSPFANYGTEARFKTELMDPHYSAKDHKSSSSHAEHDLPFCLPLERYGHSGSCYLKERDGSCSPIERQRKEPQRFLFKLDFGREKDGVSSSIINYDPAKIYSPGLSTTWNVNHQQILDHVHDAKSLCSPSLFSNYYLEYNSSQSNPSTSCLPPDFVPNFGEAKCLVPETDLLSLTFPSASKCITLAEDIDAENIPYTSNMIFSYGDQLWDSKSRSNFRQMGFSGADFSPHNPSIFHTWQFPQTDSSLCSFSIPEEARGETFTLCSEGTSYNHSWFLNFPSSLDSTINRPLLLDNVGNDWSSREVYYDDDNRWNYIVD